MEQNNPTSIYDEISLRIFESDRFKIYDLLLKNEVIRNLKLDGVPFIDLDVEDVQFLTQTASIFACSNIDKFKKIAYTISILLYSQFKNEYSELMGIVSLLLIRLGNFPAYNLLNKNYDSENLEIQIPLVLEIESATKSLDNKLEINGEELHLTDFQMHTFKSLTNNNDFSFAAPTSAGKSFLLILYIIEKLKNTSCENIIYVVPTKALINQVKNDLKKSFSIYNVTDVNVISSTVSFGVEMFAGELKNNRNVLILTQERLSNLISQDILHFKIDILIVDEAQKINDGNRGVLLERVIIQSINNYPGLSVIFSSPLASNPEFFEKYKDNLKFFKTNNSPVHQNILFVNSKKAQPFISLLSEEIKILISQHPLQKSCPSTHKAKLAYWAYHLGKEQSNILYANGASDSEELARELCKYLPDVVHERISEFKEFIKDYIHEEYTLINCLDKGVVFHYSTMPREIKEKVEELFSDESVPVNYLCCTSTLLEGMNLPAKNVFIFKPTKGSGNNMGKFDFWNLAGRAGRLLKDFYGNIYCVDTSNWGEDSYKPETSIENYNIESATEESVTAKSQDLSIYLENYKNDFPLKERELLEQTSATFILSYIDDSKNTVSKFIIDRNLNSFPSDIIKIDESIKRIALTNRLPKEILNKNSSIDPRLQNELYSYFTSQFYTVFLPKYPASGLEFYNSLVSIYVIIDKIFFNEGEKNILRRIAVLSSQWINEQPLGALIQNQIDYEVKEQKFRSVNACVRKIVEEIDRKITYKYAKYLKCYNDILEFHIQKINANASVVNLSAYLELGAFHPTTLSLISFGLSRTTAIRLRIIIGQNDLDRIECRKWLQNNYERVKSSLPSVCQDDFEKNYE